MVIKPCLAHERNMDCFSFHRIHCMYDCRIIVQVRYKIAHSYGLNLWILQVNLMDKNISRPTIFCRLLNMPFSTSDNYNLSSLYAAAFAFIISITLLIPIHTLRSVNISTTLPLSVNGDS